MPMPHQANKQLVIEKVIADSSHIKKRGLSAYKILP